MTSGKQESTLVASWSANADRWREAIASGAIASRKLVTDAAIIEAILAERPQKLLDVGCGEGWLARAVAPHVGEVVGFDVSPELIAHARGAGGGTRYHVASYADLAGSPAQVGAGFDVIAINFALLDPATDVLLRALKSIAAPRAALLIQTLHPWQIDGAYRDGWRTEHFTAFGEGAWSPMPWYFRTIASWVDLVGRDWSVESLAEPLHPTTERPASLLIKARNAR